MFYVLTRDEKIRKFYAIAQRLIGKKTKHGTATYEDIVHDIYLADPKASVDEWTKKLAKQLGKDVEAERKALNSSEKTEVRDMYNKLYHAEKMKDPAYREKRNKRNRKANKQRMLTNPKWRLKKNAKNRKNYKAHQKTRKSKLPVRCLINVNKCVRMTYKKRLHHHGCPLGQNFQRLGGMCHPRESASE